MIGFFLFAVFAVIVAVVVYSVVNARSTPTARRRYDSDSGTSVTYYSDSGPGWSGGSGSNDCGPSSSSSSDSGGGGGDCGGGGGGGE